MTDSRGSGRPISRRTFIKAVGGAGAGFVLYAYLPGGVTRALAEVPGGSLDPSTVPKYQTPLLIPPVMPRAGTIPLPGGQPADYYEISVRQFSQQILPVGLPPTTVWGYGAVAARSRRGLLLHHAPSLTIEARHGRPVRVKWINELVDADGNYLPHLLPVDPTLHWANPPGGAEGRDSRPTFTDTPGRVHRAGPDGHPRARRGRRGRRERRLRRGLVPAGRGQHPGRLRHARAPGTTSSPARRTRSYGATWGPGFATFQYPNPDRALDHLVPRPRAGHDPAQRVCRTGRLLPRPRRPGRRQGGAGQPRRQRRPCSRARRRGKATRSRPTRPTTRSRSRSRTGRSTPTARCSTPTHGSSSTASSRTYIPSGEFSPIWNPEFFGNTIMVNGNTWPFQTVQQRRYRFRFLNGCQSRFLILDFNQDPRRRGLGRSATRAASWRPRST